MPDFDYLQEMIDDMPEQFRGGQNTKIFVAALARQLQEAYRFLADLRDKRSLETAVGIQLDGIGDIVVLTRDEAARMIDFADKGEAMDDELYREYLRYKVHVNTNVGTYRDVHKALQMFWSTSPLYYSEKAEAPATMFFTTSVNDPEAMTDMLAKIPVIKPAGVALKILAVAEVKPVLVGLFAGIAMAGLGQKIEVEVKAYGTME